jgi:hypothetical protein
MADSGSAPLNTGTGTYQLIVEVVRGLDEPRSLYFKVSQHTPLWKVAGAVADQCKKPLSDVQLFRQENVTEAGSQPLSPSMHLKDLEILEDATIACVIVEEVSQQCPARGHRSAFI